MWYSNVSSIRTNRDWGSSVNQIVQIIKHAWESYVLLTVHSGMTLGKSPTWCTITLYNAFIIIIILYMFWATLCSSSGGQIVLIQQVV